MLQSLELASATLDTAHMASFAQVARTVELVVVLVEAGAVHGSHRIQGNSAVHHRLQAVVVKVAVAQFGHDDLTSRQVDLAADA